MRAKNIFRRIVPVITAVMIAAGSTGGSAYAAGTSTYITTANVNVREGAGTASKSVAVAKKGTSVSVVGENDGWSKLADGNYISSKYLAKADTTVSEVATNSYVWESLKLDDSYYSHGYYHGHGFKYVTSLSTAQTLNNNWNIVDYIIGDDGTHYYTAESASKEGKVVQNLKEGDTVTIDGVTYVIDGELHSDYRTGSATEDWENVGFQFCIQTCMPPYGGPIVLKYGHPVTADTAK